MAEVEEDSDLAVVVAEEAALHPASSGPFQAGVVGFWPTQVTNGAIPYHHNASFNRVKIWTSCRWRTGCRDSAGRFGASDGIFTNSDANGVASCRVCMGLHNLHPQHQSLWPRKTAVEQRAYGTGGLLYQIVLRWSDATSAL